MSASEGRNPVHCVLDKDQQIQNPTPALTPHQGNTSLAASLHPGQASNANNTLQQHKQQNILAIPPQQQALCAAS
jgi:hypothetical protein